MQPRQDVVSPWLDFEYLALDPFGVEDFLEESRRLGLVAGRIRGVDLEVLGRELHREIGVGGLLLFGERSRRKLLRLLCHKVENENYKEGKNRKKSAQGEAPVRGIRFG